MLIDHYEDDWSQLWWVRLRGPARIVDDRRAVELLAAKYPQYRERPPAGPVIAVDDRGADRVDELAFLSAIEQADLVRRGEVASAELVDLYLGRIERLDPGLNAFVTVCADEARAAAAGELPDGPFGGVPLPIKDLNETAGIRTTYSSRAFADYVPEFDGAVVRRLKEAGFVVHRQDEHARARDHRGDRVGAERPLPQPVGHVPDAGRVERRRGGGGRGRAGSRGAGQRRRRLDPHPRVVLRPVRDQAGARARVAGAVRRARGLLDERPARPARSPTPPRSST